MNDLLRAVTDFGFPLVLCLILIWMIQTAGKTIIRTVVEPLVGAHKEFLGRLEKQIDGQTKILESIKDLQTEVLRRLD